MGDLKCYKGVILNKKEEVRERKGKVKPCEKNTKSFGMMPFLLVCHQQMYEVSRVLPFLNFRFSFSTV